MYIPVFPQLDAAVVTLSGTINGTLDSINAALDIATL